MATQGRKRISSLLFFIVAVHILLPVIFSLAIFAVKSSQQQALNDLNEDSAVFEHIRLAGVDVSIRDGEEFWYHGVMYDVKSVEVENGNYVVCALPDKSETKLTKVKDKAEHAETRTVPPFVFLFYQSPPIFIVALDTSAPQQLGYYARHPMTSFIAISSPPPRSGFIV